MRTTITCATPCLCVYFQDRLRTLITEGVQACERALFIFDNVDEWPSGLLESIIPFMEYREEVDGVKYNKVIFILIM